MTRTVRRLLALFLLCVSAASAPAAPTITQRIAALEHRGDTVPREAADALATLLLSTAPFSAERVELLTVRGLLLADAAEPEAADQVAQALDEAARSPLAGGPAAAAAALVRARSLAQRGNLNKADALMVDALARLPVGAPPRVRLRFVSTQARIRDDAGRLEDAVRLFQEAVLLTDLVGDAWRR